MDREYKGSETWKAGLIIIWKPYSAGDIYGQVKCEMRKQRKKKESVEIKIRRIKCISFSYSGFCYSRFFPLHLACLNTLQLTIKWLFTEQYCLQTPVSMWCHFWEYDIILSMTWCNSQVILRIPIKFRLTQNHTRWSQMITYLSLETVIIL